MNGERDVCRKKIESLFSMADVRINGDRPWDIQVHNGDFYRRALWGGSLGLGESYMDGWWDAQSLDECVAHLLRMNLHLHGWSWRDMRLVATSVMFNQQKKMRAFAIGEKHYDIGNDLYRAMLDRRMTYTCGYWRDAKNLDEAQEAKLDLVCRKIGIKPGQKILDIGCGWGSFAQCAAEKYGASVVGITVSKEQAELGRALCAGLPIEIRLQDYRDVSERFDHIVSLGMFEHVGYKNYRAFMEVVHRLLADDGLFLLHTIGGYYSDRAINSWLDKYIFPGAMLPSIVQIGRSIEKLFVMEDWHNIGPDYDKTLMAWFQNFDVHWPELASRYDDRFYRMWKFYLLSCAGSFRSRVNQVWQIVLSKHGVPGGYASVR